MFIGSLYTTSLTWKDKLSPKNRFYNKMTSRNKKKKLFESKKVLAATAGLPSPDAKIIFTKAPFVQCEQLLLKKNFRQ